MVETRCHGNDTDHCCTINGETCPWLEENTVEGRRWACGLYRMHGTWDAVYADPRYQALPAAAWFAAAYPGKGCGDWPQNIPEAIASPAGRCCWQTGP